jgi:hypothetical protein
MLHGRLAAIAAVVVLAGCGEVERDGTAPRVGGGAAPGAEVDLDPSAIARGRAKALADDAKGATGGRRPQVVVAVPPGYASEEQSLTPTKSSQRSRAQVDAQIEKDLKQFRKFLATIPPARGDVAEVTPQGQAAVPFAAPMIVANVVAAANEIAKTPYRWGGGHGAWRDKGYDCSGSVSFALASAGLLDAPLTSGGFMKYGAPGKGRWITIYTNPGHMFMVVAGLRYDTSALRSGTRWHAEPRSTKGFVARHPPGL